MKLFTEFPENYELIDAGFGKKLERWGEIVTIRPEHQAYFKPVFSEKQWRDLAHWEFIGENDSSLKGTWKKWNENAPESWEITIKKCVFQLFTHSNKHIGIFPEQNENWNFISDLLTPEKRFLNAFAYTGAASVIARKTGAEVIHCDSVKTPIEIAKINQTLSSVADIKWVLEDALKFIQREEKRGNTYDLIQLDPPAWGIGANKEKWKLETLLPALLESSLSILASNGILILNTYSPKLDKKKVEGLVQQFKNNFRIENQELWMKTTTGKELYFGVLTRFFKLN